MLEPTADTMDYPSVCDPGVIYFSGSADNVVQIATNGIVTARRPGETVVTVTCGEFSYEVKIMVVE